MARSLTICWKCQQATKYASLTVRKARLDREEIWRLYQTRQWKVTVLAQHYRVSRPTIYNVLKKARLQQFTPSNSTNNRYKTIQFGLKRLAKVEAEIQARLK